MTRLVTKMAESMKKRYEEYLVRLTWGKEPDKVRIVLERLRAYLV